MPSKRIILALGTIGLIICAIVLSAFPAASQCDPPTTGADTINCNGGLVGDQIGDAGNDTITVGNTVNEPGVNIGGDYLDNTNGVNDDTIINNGIVNDIYGDSYDGDGYGNDTIINNNSAVGGVSGDSSDGNGFGNDYIENNGFIGGDGLTGDSAFSDGAGNDNIVNNGTITGNGISGDTGFGVGSGNDTITNNGVVAGQGITGDSGFGDGTGNDNIVNNGTITGNGISGDSGSANGSGDDTIINNGQVSGYITGDTGLGNGSGDDTIVNNGSVAGGIYGDSIFGSGNGNDTITNSGSVGGDIDSGGGDDYVSLQNFGIVGGTVNGGAGFDTLEFGVNSLDEAQLAIWAADIAAANPNGGTISFGGVVYTWTNFEQLISLLQLRAINGNTAPMQGFCRGNGDIDVYRIVNNEGIFAFRVNPSQVQLGLAQHANTLIASDVELGLWALDSGELQFNAPGYEFRFRYEAFCGLLDELLPQIINSLQNNNVPLFGIINRPYIED